MKTYLLALAAVIVTFLLSNCGSKTETSKKTNSEISSNSNVKENTKVKPKCTAHDTSWTEGSYRYQVIYDSECRSATIISQFDSLLINGVYVFIVRLQSTSGIWYPWSVTSVRSKDPDGLRISPHSDQDLTNEGIRSQYKVGDTVDVHAYYGDHEIESNFGLAPGFYFSIKLDSGRSSIADFTASRYDHWTPSEIDSSNKNLKNYKKVLNKLLQATSDKKLKDLRIL